MERVIVDRSKLYIPNANIAASPGWLLAAHKAAYPYEHHDETEQLRSRMRKVITTTTISTEHDVRDRAKRWVPTAAIFADPFNTSTPKIRDDEVLMRPRPLPERYAL